MSINLLKKLILFSIFYITIPSLTHAASIDISHPGKTSLLEKSTVYFDKEELPLEEIINQNPFVPYHKIYINRGVTSETIWISFTLRNDSSQNIQKVVVLSSPLVDYVALHDKALHTEPVLKGAAYISDKHFTLFPYFRLNSPPHSSKEYLFEVKSKNNPVDFGLWLYDEDQYIEENQIQQFIDILLVGMVLALMLYGFILALYTKDKSYFYYSLYLFALIYQQLTYLGLTQIYLPSWFVVFDIHITVFKITFLVITAALFSMHFLKTKHMPPIHKGYKIFIIISFIEMILLSISQFYNLEIIILTGTFFIIYNLWAGHISYNKGNKQARLFIVGFGLVFISYIFIILDAIGLTSIMQDFQNILMVTTALEALILLLAFADRYIILQKEKDRVDACILTESKRRTEIIQDEVNQKTKELKCMVETRELLIKEIHHRVKNNLQIILSMVRLQSDSMEEKESINKLNLTNLENRINAIAKTYDMLIIKENLETIDMKEYTEALIHDIQRSYPKEKYDISIETDIDATLPLRDSIYIGLIINEMVTNTYKYAFDEHQGLIKISLHKEKSEYELIYQDDGKGFDKKEKNDSFGLKLIDRLVHNQLKGKMEMHTNDCTRYTIRFTI